MQGTVDERKDEEFFLFCKWNKRKEKERKREERDAQRLAIAKKNSTI